MNSSSWSATRSERGVRRHTVAILSQVYVPDEAAVGQYLHEAAAALVQRGHRLRVLTSASGYDDPTMRYPTTETRDGVEIERLPFSSFGKRSMGARLLGGSVFLAQALARALTFRHLDHVIVSTSPPHAGPIGALLSMTRRVPLSFWVMDINPDQAVSQGHVDESSLAARALSAAMVLTLQRANTVVTLDRFMADRLANKTPVANKTAVIPLWPLLSLASGPGAPRTDNPFVKRHDLADKKVVMYSGNLSLTHPLDTLLEAAARLHTRTDILFMFIGGGNGKPKVEAFARAHPQARIRTLPYQPLSEVRHSLSAADVHVVTMGEGQVGIVHPCKVYGAMAMARPLLYVGPNPSHVTDIIERFDLGASLHHGDVHGVTTAIQRLVDMPRSERQALGERSRKAIETEFSRNALVEHLCAILAETGLPGQAPPSTGIAQQVGLALKG